MLNSGNIPKGTVLLLRPTGLEGGFRGESDGFTYFGVKKKDKGEVANDFVIPLETNQRGQHFLVYFKTETNSYWIKDLAKGFGVFLKLDFPLVLADNMMVSIGESFLVFSMSQTRMRIRLFGGIGNGKE